MSRGVANDGPVRGHIHQSSNFNKAVLECQSWRLRTLACPFERLFTRVHTPPSSSQAVVALFSSVRPKIRINVPRRQIERRAAGHLRRTTAAWFRSTARDVRRAEIRAPASSTFCSFVRVSASIFFTNGNGSALDRRPVLRSLSSRLRAEMSVPATHVVAWSRADLPDLHDLLLVVAGVRFRKLRIPLRQHAG